MGEYGWMEPHSKEVKVWVIIIIVKCKDFSLSQVLVKVRKTTSACLPFLYSPQLGSSNYRKEFMLAIFHFVYILTETPLQASALTAQSPSSLAARYYNNYYSIRN